MYHLDVMTFKWCATAQKGHWDHIKVWVSLPGRIHRRDWTRHLGPKMLEWSVLPNLSEREMHNSVSKSRLVTVWIKFSCIFYYPQRKWKGFTFRKTRVWEIWSSFSKPHLNSGLQKSVVSLYKSTEELLSKQRSQGLRELWGTPLSKTGRIYFVYGWDQNKHSWLESDNIYINK